MPKNLHYDERGNPYSGDLDPSKMGRGGLSVQDFNNLPYMGNMVSVASGGAPPTASQLQQQQNAQNLKAQQMQPTYGSYTIDASGKMVPIGAGGPPQTPLYKQPSGNYSYINPGGGVLPGGPGSSVNTWTVPPPGGGGGGGYDPAAAFNQRPNQGLPGLNTGGVNPYLTDPLMAGYRGMQNPLYLNQQQQNDFYGDPELFGGG